MSLSRVVSAIFSILGTLFSTLALVAGGFFFVAFVERIQHGRGIMFADVEFLGLMAAAFLVPGLLLLWLARRIGKTPSDKAAETG